MDPRVPKGFRGGLDKTTTAQAVGNRVRVRIDNSTVALVLGALAFGGTLYSMVYNSHIARQGEQQRAEQEARHLAENTAQETRLLAAMQAAESRGAQRAVEKETEVRMLEYYLLELDAKVIAAGIKRPDESIAKKLEQAKKGDAK